MQTSDFILITGGTGFIGSHTAVEILNNIKNFNLVVADNLSNSYKEAISGIEKISGKKIIFELTELTDFSQVKKLFLKYDFKAVLHFAAFKAVAESIENPLKYYYNNISSLLNLLKTMEEKKSQTLFIFSSSCTVYGLPDYLPVDEKHPFKEPTSPYGHTKQWSEKILQKTTKQLQGKLKVISLRYFNPIGAHPSGFLGESPKVRYNLIPILTETATGKRPYIYIYGNDYPTKDGTPVRDYIYIIDLAKAHYLALKRLLNAKQQADYEYFNLGSGKGFSVLEIIKTFEKVSGKKINYKITERRPGDIAAIYASSDLAVKILGWKNKTDLEFMLKTAWLWESKYKYY